MGQGRAVALKGAQLCAAWSSLLAPGAEVGSITSSLMHTCPAVRTDNTQKTFKASVALVKLCMRFACKSLNSFISNCYLLTSWLLWTQSQQAAEPDQRKASVLPVGNELHSPATQSQENQQHSSSPKCCTCTSLDSWIQPVTQFW